jgi:hypothetical protein
MRRSERPITQGRRFPHATYEPQREGTRPGSSTKACYRDSMVVRAVPGSRPKTAFNGVKVFAATMFRDREGLGERVTQWLAEHSELDVVDMKVTQSSDAAFHCITISVFYFESIASHLAR